MLIINKKIFIINTSNTFEFFLNIFITQKQRYILRNKLLK